MPVGVCEAKLQVLAVYSLAENEMQLPFAVTLSSILSENEKVLLLDLQENSGLSQLMGEFLFVRDGRTSGDGRKRKILKEQDGFLHRSSGQDRCCVSSGKYRVSV